ncbi:MAG: glycosyl transferase, family 2 [Nocardioides sp.]|jgi:glycosyltransferase involved in cell wall biosynthesis|uniref:glycosyltransferase n=1 Tax=Nocardioides sp. TaxID=35761 RepID=UPI00261053F4|nr:glycosyltransferase [Nocardioides sp.]MCW2834411.1 glycosyl transferase, family 2 [Nocardioides sp.]
MSQSSTQPLVRRNEWRSLTPPDLGRWTPTKSVSVVIPTWSAQATLPCVLAGLAAQTYPAHLLEVVVVDDGNPTPVVLPEVRPENTRLVRVTAGWGRANACHTGALASEGDVIAWLDADMLAFREHLEAQLRWHHEVDYAVVLGTKRFVDPAILGERPTTAVRDAVASGEIATAWDWDAEETHKWVEGMWRRTDDLTLAGPRAFRAHVGATGSLNRALYTASGGMATELRLGEDMELGHRLSEAGGVLIPEHASRAWHLGRTHVMEHRDQINRYNDAFLANLVPTMRPKRNRRGRRYDVPYLEVVVDARGALAQDVIGVVDSLLDSSLDDLRVVVLGDWTLTDARQSPLGDPHIEQRIVHRTYARDQRVELRAEAPAARRSPWRLSLDGVSVAPREDAIEALLDDLERHHDGAAVIEGVGRVERTAAVSRVRRVHGTLTDEGLDAAYGLVRLAGGEAGWVPVAEREVARYEGKMKPPVERPDPDPDPEPRSRLFGRRR